jgi:hypothetical protein
MINKEEIHEKIDIFQKKIKKKIFLISALKHMGLKTIKKNLTTYVY